MPDHVPDSVSDPSVLLGRSVHDDLVAGYLRFHAASEPSAVFPGADAYYGGKDSGFGLAATTAAAYLGQFTDRVTPLRDEPDERFVHQIFLSDRDCDGPGSARYAHPLPLGLAFGDDAATVTEKLGVGPIETSTRFVSARVAAISTYRRGEITWLVKLDEANRLVAVYVRPLFASERQAIAREATLEDESRNIDPANVDKVEALRASFPMPRWRECLEDGDDLFSEQNIAETEALLGEYVDTVKTATAQRSAPAVYAATKTLIEGLNAINRRDGFIETLERDELGVLIDQIIAASGFKTKQGEDITLGWREW